VTFIGGWRWQFYKSSVKQKLIVYTVPGKTVAVILFSLAISVAAKGQSIKLSFISFKNTKPVSFDKHHGIDATAFTKINFGK